ncbi:hypothetical protein FQV39_32695 (plasmid) [Bosea sp. F3-2]|uniref:hypothetical protein n=1 Tax=Bosea sp. F3-2 TaxID=2599640 RepID=UPI0011EDD805|nr:hypothetical protein [Bosea sp. F3-2]QEL27366.1 hypothetical protein FQV39_32695 [Bosea sp. F3-2]
MDIEKIKALIDLVSSSAVMELDLSQDATRFGVARPIPRPSGLHPARSRFGMRPARRGGRVDRHVITGYTVPSADDSMIAELIALGATGEGTFAGLRGALAEARVDFIRTNIPLHRALLDDPTCAAAARVFTIWSSGRGGCNDRDGP